MEERYVIIRIVDFNVVQEKCKCRMLNSKLPVGHESSWEMSAPLHHGSHIKFGCIEFVFCIVNHPAPFEERSYNGRRRTDSPLERDQHLENPFYGKNQTHKIQNDDLTSKLSSILSALSSDSRTCEKLSSLTSDLPSKVSDDVPDRGRFANRSKSVLTNGSCGNDDASSISSDCSSVLSTFNYSDKENQASV